jgi:hypothetical protein
MKYLTQFIHLLIRVVFRMILLGSMLIMLTPFAYFTWRANQPMELPQFDGQTYFDWLQERHAAYTDLAQQYRQSHPNKEVKQEICFYSELGVQLVAAFPNSGFYALAGLYPSLQSFTNPRDLRDGLVPAQVTWVSLLPAWWKTYEQFVWGMAEHASHGPVPYCRISP